MATKIKGPVPEQSSLAESWDRSTGAPQQNLGYLLDRIAYEHPDQTAVASFHQSENVKGENLHDKEMRLTFAELHNLGVRLASYLSSKGIRPSQRVLVALYNQVEWCIAFWATAYLGCQFVPLDPRSLARSSDAAHFVRTIRPDVVLVTTSQVAGVVDEVFGPDMALPIRILVQTSGNVGHGWVLLAEIVSKDLQENQAASLSPNASEDTAIIFFTSGTGALPKACPLSAVNITAPAYAFAAKVGIEPNHHVCQHLPGFHIFSVVMSLSAWLQGAAVIFPSATFDPSASIRIMEKTQSIHVPCVPTMIQAIASHPGAPRTFLSLASINLGGTTISGHVMDIAKSMDPKRIAVGYGMSEGVLTLLDVQNGYDAGARTRGEVSVGVAISGAKIRICSPGSRVPLHRGEVGELHQGGLPVFGGYINLTEEPCYNEEGVNFIATGDQAFMDDEGHVYILGRYKDLIIRGGENVSPAKIEHYLAGAHGLSVQVVGFPDSLVGEVPVAVIKQGTEAGYEVEELRKDIQLHLGPAYAPARILHLRTHLQQDEYPSTISGKIKKTILRQWVWQYLKNEPSNRKQDNNTAIKSNTTQSHLQAIWAEICGLDAENISIGTSIHTFADSMMLIEFSTAVFLRLHKRLTVTELHENATIESQAFLLESKCLMDGTAYCTQSPATDDNTMIPTSVVGVMTSSDEIPDMSPLRILSLAKCDQARIHSIRHKTSQRLAGLRLSWEDLDEIVPMTEAMTLKTRGHRLWSGNYRHVWTVKGFTPAHIKDTLRRWITRHPLLRSTCVSDGSEIDYYMNMAPTDAWLSRQILDGDVLDSEDELKSYRLADLSWDYVCPDGPLLQVHVFPLRQTGQIGLIIHIHHNIFDGLVLRKWYLDLWSEMIHRPLPINFHPYRDFSAECFAARESISGKSSVDFFVRRLQGIGSMRKQAWPQQRAPGWMKGDDRAWKNDEGLFGAPGLRVAIDGKNALGARGFIYQVHLPYVPDMRSRHGISAPMIGKAACVLFNLHATGGEEAIFTSLESGRSWPMERENSPYTGPVNPLDIDGPTVVNVVNRIRVGPWETTMQLLTRLQDDQLDIEKHSHAPASKIIEGLARNHRTGAEDVEAFKSILQQQIYDWLPTVRSNHDMSKMPIKLLDHISRMDRGIAWVTKLLPGDILQVETSWDDAQLSNNEASQALSEFLSAFSWLADPQNLAKPLCHCRFDNPNVKDVSRSNENL